MKNLALKITVGGKNYPLKFGYACLRLLSALWGCTLAQLFDKLGQIEGREIESFVDIVYCALSVANPDVDFDADEVGDFIIANPDKLQEIIAAFQQSMPQAKPDDAGKPGAAAPQKANR
jgi:hypothetical protein